MLRTLVSPALALLLIGALIAAPAARAQTGSGPIRISIPPQAAPAAPSAAAPPTAGGDQRLSLETARPLPVPPRPDIRTPGTVKAPPRFQVPEVMAAPPQPEIAAVAPTPPPPRPAAATPPVPSTLLNPPQLAPPQAAAPPPSPPAAPPQVAAVQPPRPPEPKQPAAPAALPPPPQSVAPLPQGPLSVVFDGGSADLPESAEALLAGIAERLRDRETLRLQLRSYAGGTPETAREARQLSLARALAMRERLAAYGVRSTRIDIRALGTTRPDGPANAPDDRIDVEFLND